MFLLAKVRIEINSNTVGIFITLWLLLATGCATIDFSYLQKESYVVSGTNETFLGRKIVHNLTQRPVGQSGFHPLVDGADALAVRLLLAKYAERSIDVQYYLIRNDMVGSAFIHALLQAADRGVRIRLLIDDIFTSGHDISLSALYSHPNFEIRIFNPFQRGIAGKFKSAVTDFERINRRMHNKSFTVDNQVTIIGGRNIAEEYFGASKDAKFGDLDVLGIGPIVQDVSNMFDTYWNHQTSLPVPAFIKEPKDPTVALDKLRWELANSQEKIQDSKYTEAILSKQLTVLENDKRPFYWAQYQLVVDSPNKGIKNNIQAESIVTPLMMSLCSSKNELLIVSPYFVPQKKAIRTLMDLQKRGVKVTIITNSLAANNQLAVHGGYATSRKTLLAAGIKIYEMRPNADIRGTEFIDSVGAKATLHTKAFIVDGKEIFIGSFNFDPRSANLNTELGVIIYDPTLALFFSKLAKQALQKQTFELFLNNRGKIRWRGYQDGEEIIYYKEPETTWRKRLAAWVARIIPKSQL